jgi:aquaporin-4
MLKFRRHGQSQPGPSTDPERQDGARGGRFLQEKILAMSVMSTDDMKSPRFWRAVLAELLASIILVLFGCGSWIETDVEEHPMTVRIAFTFGFLYAIILYCLRPVSGGHVNPSVTVAMVVTRQISLARATFYCLAHVLGGIIGAALLLSVTSPRYMHRDMLGCTLVATEMSAGQGFGIEFMISFFFVFVVFSCYAKVEKAEMTVYNLFTPFIVGFAAVAIHLFAVGVLYGNLDRSSNKSIQ